MMWSFVGITFSFLGTLITLLSVLVVEDKIPGSWGKIISKSENEGVEEWAIYVGLALLSIGYVIQAGIELSKL